ncbi:ABC transporter ATP-binding protein [Bifidobacterium aemilianum]|uniref:ABC transporter ATP-binding protein n=2 Tax=Bifidobacterium aemilianum TaxID=2493120 RepID=A0A366KA92_9BIFI|nr:ABC transporter ATP-binding protein [Bifidobacterium aemilianum]
MSESPKRGRPDGGQSSAGSSGSSKPLSASASLVFDHWGYRHASRSHFAVQGLNLSIPAGQRVLLLGASGIGKSTILAGAAGLLGSSGEEVESGQSSEGVEDADGGISQGRVLVDGTPVQEARGRVGLVLQDPDAQVIFERLGDNVAFGPENMALDRPQIWERVRQSMAAVGLADLQLHRSTMHLSGGQLQRLALAGALAMRPGVLLLDEPTANLDPEGVRQIVGAVSSVLEADHSTMLLVEHRAGPWIDMIDRVIVLGLADTAPGGEGGPSGQQAFKDTVILADGSPAQVFGNPDIDFASLGIWLPERYARPQDRIGRIHTSGEPSYPARTGTGEVLLSTKDLAIGRQGQSIADHINLDFHSGQISALVGANGAGKSTLSMTLAGLLEPVAGQVLASERLQGGAQGSSPFGWKSTQLASRISYVFQNPEHQFARASVLEEVMLGPLRTGASPEEAKSRALTLLKRFSLRQYAHMNPYTLSGGEKRRLTVASALAAAPQVLILDEPTFGQDRSTWLAMVRLIHDLRGDGVSIIVVTHDRELVRALGARIVELGTDGQLDRSWQHDSEEDGGGKPGDGPDPAGQTGHVGLAQADRKPGGSAADRPGGSPCADELPADGQPQLIQVSPTQARTEDPRQSSRSPYLASLNPSFRLIGGFLTALILLFSLDWVSASVALGLEFVLLMGIGFSPWRVVKFTWPVFIGAPGSALAVILYGKSGGHVWWQWGLIQVSDKSLILALATALRILAIGIPAIIAVLGIDATDLADSFSQVLHLPDRFVYGGLAGMRLFSVLRDDWTALTASRRSRGLGDDSKIKSFFPQAFALLVLSIRRSTMLATAMEARGFGGDHPRSSARISQVHPRDWVFLAICLALPLVALLTAYLTGHFAFFGN